MDTDLFVVAQASGLLFLASRRKLSQDEFGGTPNSTRETRVLPGFPLFEPVIDASR